MCGRYTLHSKLKDILDKTAAVANTDISNSYNITPSSTIPVVRHQDKRELVNCHWGLIPHWTKDKKYKPINARAETINEKPFFRDAFKKKRCLIPGNGFYEWQGSKGHKQPYYIKLQDEEIFAFAGLWERWESNDQIIESCTIITTEANETMAPIHHRMPVIINSSDYDQWLEQGGKDLLVPYAGDMISYLVSKKVNSPDNDGSELIQAISH